ncbi:lysophospholipid acyltransferase family protein [Xanthobacter autotrophicus]|uniref:lysophospholipid acyltransferase family protein n=1 Tax=Xanthobacter autotrophicus TaxID=280 RepID=UPI001FED0662|nr:lysophospholipid acyltransferase family protein [Xanthobacter autotrophicus]
MTPAPAPAKEPTRLPLEFGGLEPLGPEQPGVSRFLDRVRAAAVLVPVAVVTAVGIPLQWLSLKLSLPTRRSIPQLYHRILLKLIGVRVKVIGAPAAGRPLLILANHSSWIDILVIGSITPLVFVAKSEVGRWPLIGLLAKFQRTVFVDRQRRHATGEVNRTIAERLQDGDPVVLFAEGTSSDGNRVLPFRTALVGAVREAIADGAEVTVQPLAVSYVRLQGLPMGRLHRHVAAWYGDMDLVPHLLEVLRHGSIDVEVSFGEPVQLDEAHDRKSVTRQCEEAVRLMSVEALTGRPPETGEAASHAPAVLVSPVP